MRQRRRSARAGAIDSLDALAAQQAANGQIPKYVDPEGRDADFWYLGCIDATLWWLIAVDHVRRATASVGAARWQDARSQRAIAWLLAQEHQHLRLLQQNEASDWADIMPRSGYVLYTNALWYRGQAALRAARRRGHARTTSTTSSIRSSATCPNTTAPACCAITRAAAAAIRGCT